MISKIAIAAVAMIALGVGGFFMFRPAVPSIPASSDAGNPPQTRSAWIEVVAPPVNEYAADGAMARTLASGDGIAPGTTIASGAGAKAVIHFPDGSVARLDEKSRITLAEETFDAKDNTLRVRIRLTTGRIWSKVVSLTTPASLWEVKTSNTVVAVRGTAFGVEFEDGASRVIGAENAVKVIVVDPATGDAIPGAEDWLEAGRMITIRNDAITEIKARPETVTKLIRAVPEDVGREKWIEDALREDKKLDQKAESRGEAPPKDSRENESSIPGPTPTEIRPALRAEEPSAPPTKQDTTPIFGGDATETVAASPTPARLVIEFAGGARTIAQGDAVPMRAFLLIPDGARREITKEAAWRVIGPIGTIDAGAIFHAELLPPITEVGEGVGAIVATWKDARAGETLTAQTPIIRVELLLQKVVPEG